MWLQSALFGFDELWSQIDFRLVMAYEVVTVPGWSYENPLLSQTELWLVRAGRCHIQSGERRALAQGGDLVLLRAGEYRLTTEADGAPLDIVGFGFRAHLLGTMELIALLDPPLCFPDDGARVRPLLESVTRESGEKKIGYGLATSGYAQLALVEALREALRQADRVLDSMENALESEAFTLQERVLQKLQSAQNGDVAQALGIIATRWGEPLDVAQIAATLHLSAPHFSRKFKAALGLGPMEYLRLFRLRQARRSLTQSDDSVARIAVSCGFQDAAYFSRAFKKQFGSSPLEFRRYLRALSK